MGCFVTRCQSECYKVGSPMVFPVLTKFVTYLQCFRKSCVLDKVLQISYRPLCDDVGVAWL